jgi:hypothetical protein
VRDAVDDPFEGYQEEVNSMSYASGVSVAWDTTETFHHRYNDTQKVNVYYDADYTVRYYT